MKTDSYSSWLPVPRHCIAKMLPSKIHQRETPKKNSRTPPIWKKKQIMRREVDKVYTSWWDVLSLRQTPIGEAFANRDCGKGSKDEDEGFRLGLRRELFRREARVEDPSNFGCTEQQRRSETTKTNSNAIAAAFIKESNLYREKRKLCRVSVIWPDVYWCGRSSSVDESPKRKLLKSIVGLWNAEFLLRVSNGDCFLRFSCWRERKLVKCSWNCVGVVREEHTLQDSQRPPEVLTRPRHPRGWLMQEYIFDLKVGWRVFVGVN